MEAVMTMPQTQPIANNTHMVSKPVAVETNSVKTDQTQEAGTESKQLQKSDDLKPEEVTKEFNKLSDKLNLDVKFAYNEKIDTVYINVTDKDTGRVIRKLPTEEAMKIKESMQDLVGVLFDKKG
jgi:flagellar protein FlaG